MTSVPLARICIVDDEAANMRALCDTLRDHGYGTEGFTAGEEALGALRERPFDVLLTDLMMPGMDGVALLGAALKIDAHVVGVLMTGKGTIETAVQAMQAGALDYVLKPLKVSALLPVLSRAVAVRQLRLENLDLRNTVAIHELNQAIAYTLDVNVLLDKVADAALAQFEADEASVMLLAEGAEFLRVAAVRGERRETLLGSRVPIGKGIAGHVAAHREPLVLQGEVREAGLAPLYPRPGIQTALCMPMMTRNKLVGVLNVNYTQKARTIPFGQIKVLSIFANAAAAGIEASRLYEDERKTYGRYREVLYMAADGIISIDQDQRIVLFNGGAEKIFGYDPEEVLGKPITVLLPQEMAETHHRHVEAFGQGPDQSRAMGRRERLVGRRKDGTLLNVEVGISKRSENSDLLYTAVVRDVTQRVEDEDHIAQLNERLNQAQRMEGLGRLAGGVAHDFNNLLTVIMAYSELQIEDLSTNDPRRADLEGILHAARQAADLTRQLLAFSRRQVLELKVLNLNDVVAGIEKMLQRVIGEDLDLAMALTPDLGAVRADPGQLEQVLMNLVVNARDAMPDGGQVTIETAAVELDDAYAKTHSPVVPGPYVLLAVSDTGVGMDEATKNRIFEPFFTTKELGKGTGLGLATVYGIVKQSGGHVWVYSEPGRGTTFKIYLPRVTEPAEALHPVGAGAEVQGGSETILVVEDQADVRTVVRKVLERCGYSILEADRPSAALALADAARALPDLLITDVVMPELNGRELARQLEARWPGLKVLYLSGYTDDAIVRHGVLESGVSFLQKPFTPDTLARKVRQVLDSRS